MKKYIVNDLADQKITGNLDIEGALRTIDNNNYTIGTYRALMTQTGYISGSNLNNFFGALVIGQVYTITNYVPGDDFFNVGQVISGSMNQTGCEFIATGEVPSWDNGSTIETQGELVVRVLENSLGFDLEWSEFSPGVYTGVRSILGPIYNSFPRSLVYAKIGESLPLGPPYPFLKKYCGPSGIAEKDQVIAVVNFDEDILNSVADNLYYTPIEINFKIDLDTTPITLTGNSPGVPIQNVYINIYSYDTFVTTIYADNTGAVNNLTELVTLLNNDTVTGYLGTFSNVNGITLVMPTNVKKQFCPNTPLVFEIGGSGV